MNYRILPVLLGLSLAGTACGKTVVMRDTGSVHPLLSSAQVYYDDGPGIQDSVRMVVKDPAGWQDIWARATANQMSPPPLPLIDFTREMIVVVGAGKMKPGDQIRVDSAGVRDGLFVVVVRTITDCESFPSDAFPLQIVRVVRADEPQVFEERQERAARCS